MPPIKIEDDGQSHSTQPATNPSTTTRVMPHVVTERITSQRDDISTITGISSTSLPKVKTPLTQSLCRPPNSSGMEDQRSRTNHKRGRRNYQRHANSTITLRHHAMQWNRLRWCTIQPEAVPERDVHLMSGLKLFGHWRGKGGRPWAAGIPDDICHLLKILDEKDGKLEVQFVGCAKSKSEWWESNTVKETYIELWDEWVQGMHIAVPFGQRGLLILSSARHCWAKTRIWLMKTLIRWRSSCRWGWLHVH